MKASKQKKRVIQVGLVSLLVLGFMGSAYGQNTSPAFSLTIQEQEKPAIAGSKVYITVTQTNISTANVGCNSVSHGDTDMVLKYEIRREDGTPLVQRANADRYMTDFSQCQLPPGESVTRRYLLSWLFDLSVPGKYSVQVSHYGEPYEEPRIMSNIITLQVVSAKGADSSNQ
jgi:hypothetical protein